MIAQAFNYKEIIDNYFDIVKQCRQPSKFGKAILATLPGRRYPYVYPRDIASTSRVLRRIWWRYDSLKTKSFSLLKEIAIFILNCQRKNGYWGQRYNLDGGDESIYRQEDNVAHGIISLLNYGITALESERDGESKDLDEVGKAVLKGIEFSTKNYYRQGINLFFSTTSIHETPIERGFSIWVNFAYLRALHQAQKFFSIKKMQEKVDLIQTILDRFENNVFRTFKREFGYVRRYTPEGTIDLRPDITLFSPFYFGFENLHDEIMKKTIDTIEHRLWDPNLGGLQRYLPFVEDIATHVHAGNGPWMQYTSILAQYYYETQNVKEGDKLLKLIDGYRTEEGYIPEHLSTKRRFEEFMRIEWDTGLEFKKEFSPEILIPGVPFNRIVEELNNMKNAYQRLANCRAKPGEDGIIRFACPLLWSHSEYTLAVLEREKSEWSTSG